MRCHCVRKQRGHRLRQSFEERQSQMAEGPWSEDTQAVATPSRDGPLRRAKGLEENLGLGNVVRDLEGYRHEGIEGASESRRIQKPFGALKESI